MSLYNNEFCFHFNSLFMLILRLGVCTVGKLNDLGSRVTWSCVVLLNIPHFSPEEGGSVFL